MKWNEVIGQEQTKHRLRKLLAEGRVPHAIMLAGNTGYGTLALAGAFASALLCTRNNAAEDKGASLFGEEGDIFGSGTGLFGEEAGTLGEEAGTSRENDGAVTATGIHQDAAEKEADTEACGECKQCLMLRNWQHPDLHFSFPIVKLPSMGTEHKPVCNDFMQNWYEMVATDGMYFSFEQWMEQIGATTQQAIITANESDDIGKKISLTSSQGGYKVVIIWLAERMNDVSANKILKTLEEPTNKTVFILVVERPELLLETIRSRVQRIDVPKIEGKDITEALVARRGIDSDTAASIARAADGNWLAAVEQLMPDSESRMFLDLFIMLMRQVYAKDVRGMKKWSETTGGFGREKQKRLLAYFMRMIREAFVSNFNAPELSYMTREEEQFVKKFGRFINETNVIEINDLFELAVRDISQNTNQKVVFFDTALRLTVLLLRK